MARPAMAEQRRNALMMSRERDCLLSKKTMKENKAEIQCDKMRMQCRERRNKCAVLVGMSMGGRRVEERWPPQLWSPARYSAEPQ